MERLRERERGKWREREREKIERERAQTDGMIFLNPLKQFCFLAGFGRVPKQGALEKQHNGDIDRNIVKRFLN